MSETQSSSHTLGQSEASLTSENPFASHRIILILHVPFLEQRTFHRFVPLSRTLETEGQFARVTFDQLSTIRGVSLHLDDG